MTIEQFNKQLSVLRIELSELLQARQTRELTVTEEGRINELSQEIDALQTAWYRPRKEQLASGVR